MKVLGIVLLFVAVYAKHEEYAGYKSYYVEPQSEDQLKVLRQLGMDLDVDTLSYPSVQREGLVLVKPEQNDAYVKELTENAIPFRAHSLDVKATLEVEDEIIQRGRQESRSRNGGKNLPYDAYQEYPAIDAYLQDIAARYPDRVTLVTPANSFEGRPIRYLKISTSNFTDESKPIIFIEGGIHAREWIAPPTVTWAIHKLVEDVTENDLLEKFDWILLPLSNPDGYQYSHSRSRFWRKTRSTDQHLSSKLCPGVDGNRNYDFFWRTVGASSNACSDTYAGSKAFSEIETQVVRDIINENLSRMAMYLTMHSAGSMILYPWGHDGSLSSNAFGLHAVAVDMAQAIDAVSLKKFPRYVVGNAVLVIGYPASGASEDYAHLVGVPLSFTYELPGFGRAFNVFHLNPIYIQQVADETWQGIVAGARRAAKLL